MSSYREQSRPRETNTWHSSSSDANTITFAFDGKEYTIDLSDENAEKFREVMAPYVENGHRVSSSGKAKPARRAAAKSSSSGDTKAIREWARSNGYEVSDRGRLPSDIMDAYAAAN